MFSHCWLFNLTIRLPGAGLLTMSALGSSAGRGGRELEPPLPVVLLGPLLGEPEELVMEPEQAKVSDSETAAGRNLDCHFRPADRQGPSSDQRARIELMSCLHGKGSEGHCPGDRRSASLVGASSLRVLVKVAGRFAMAQRF